MGSQRFNERARRTRRRCRLHAIHAFLGKDVLKRRLNLHKHINYNHERVIAHFWTEFAINENLMFYCCAYSAAHQMRVRLSTQLKLNRKKMFFVIWGKGLTHHRLHNHITKNILQPFYLTSYRRFHLLWTEEHLPPLFYKIKFAKKVTKWAI